MYANSEAEMREAFLRGEVKAGIVIPENMEKDIRANLSPRVLVLIDGSNIYIGNNVYSYAASILGTLSVGVQAGLLEAGGITPYTAEQDLRTLTLGERMLFVPQMGNFVYAFAGYLGIFIQQTFMSVLSPVLLREKRAAPIAKDCAVFGLLTVAAMLLCLLTAHALGGYPLRGSVFLALLVHVVFILDITAITLLISVFFKDVCHCVQFVMLLSIPAFMTSGYIWPEFVMPAGFAALIKAVWPLHYYVLPLRDIMLKGAGFWETSGYIAGGLIYAAIWFPVAVLVFRKKAAGAVNA
jgi:ABC-2 type transport system permease protein